MPTTVNNMVALVLVAYVGGGHSIDACYILHVRATVVSLLLLLLLLLVLSVLMSFVCVAPSA